MARLDNLLEHAIEAQASDLHVSSWDSYYTRIHGRLIPILPDQIPQPLQCDDKTEILLEILSEKQRQEFLEKKELDFSYHLNDEWRFRANYYFQNRGGVDGVFRIIKPHIPTMEDLGLPESVLKLTHLHQGIVLLTGPSGSGKTTTLASMMNEINLSRSDHIISVEDPIEYVHHNKSCIVSQREVGHHTDTFASALRVALREDPDVIVVGEMRDLETISMALTCAETGHLVLGTLHTTNAASTVDRIIDVFPPSSQEQIRVMIADSLRGVISQQLVPINDYTGRALALEVLVGSNTLSSLIREKKTFNIKSYMQTGKIRYGMQTMDESIRGLQNKGLIDKKTALFYSHDPVNYHHL